MNILYLIAAAVLLLLAGMKLYKKQKGAERVVSIIEANCSRCRSCVRKCKHNVLELRSGENENHVVVAYPELCTGCGHCTEVCRFNAIEMVKR